MVHYFYGGMGWSGWLIMTLTMVAFWTLVVYAVVAITRLDGPKGARDADPLRILERRFARGEVDEAEYRRLQGVSGAGVR